MPYKYVRIVTETFSLAFSPYPPHVSILCNHGEYSDVTHMEDKGWK